MAVVALAIVGACDRDARTRTPRPQVDDSATEPPSLEVRGTSPWVVDPAGGSRLTLTGSGFLAAGALQVEIGGVPAISVEVRSDHELVATTAPMPRGEGFAVAVSRDGAVAQASDTVRAWSPDELAGARVFDAAHGVRSGQESAVYTWQRLAPSMGDAVRMRDGNTTTWLPGTGRYWMVGGWNGYQVPDGFSDEPTGYGYPLQNTTNEVWSSPDGVTWTLELEHGHDRFQRRHVHNALPWREALWVIGGDRHQGFYNHDVLVSEDGRNWRVVLGPGREPPPWEERAFLLAGVYADRLWVAGGQDFADDPDQYVYHNDVWASDDGERWERIVPDAPASPTRWGGCGGTDGLVEFRGRMWLVGCARHREDGVPAELVAEVWSTTDGASWQRHADPPWKGKSWPSVVVWDDKLWILFGFTFGDPEGGWPIGNANETWYSEDGETWRSLPPDAPVPGSHGQGVAVREDSLLLAGGNYNFGTGAGPDLSTWRLVPVRGREVGAWSDRGGLGFELTTPGGVVAPTLVEDAFFPGSPGLFFDGSSSVMDLDALDEHAQGFTVWFVARAPWMPTPPGWIEAYDPEGTILGGSAVGPWPVSSVGLARGEVAYVSLDTATDQLGNPVFTSVHGGSGLQEATGEVRVAGISHDPTGEVIVWMDGNEVGRGSALYDLPRAWRRVGGGMDGGGEGAYNRFAGTLGAVVVLPTAADEETAALVHAWAQGRFAAR